MTMQERNALQLQEAQRYADEHGVDLLTALTAIMGEFRQRFPKGDEDRADMRVDARTNARES